MKKLLKSKPLLITVAIILGIALINTLIKLQVNRTYNSFLGNSKIISAFHEGNSEMIAEVVKKHGLRYQKISDGRIEYESDGWLPNPDIISYRQMASEQVLLPDIVSSLKNQRPYKIFRGAGIYIAVPICGSSCQSFMYVVYARAVL